MSDMAKRYNGRHVVDKITGFTGIVTGCVEYLSGCNQILVLPQCVDNKPVDGVWIDVQRFNVLDDPPIILDNGETPGFDKAPPKR